ncbi:YSIRK-type signal peptide-containing protein, partial [Mammaliicoccus sciuri]|uniref:YSIRK-type signal peptide-containing protein n=1 Tax=Mammaliicoccus sciuri TaxID=1296 RepID=UPI001FB1CC61
MNNNKGSKQKFSIRKLKMVTGSILIGTIFILSYQNQALASEEASEVKQTPVSKVSESNNIESQNTDS